MQTVRDTAKTQMGCMQIHSKNDAIDIMNLLGQLLETAHLRQEEMHCNLLHV